MALQSEKQGTYEGRLESLNRASWPQFIQLNVFAGLGTGGQEASVYQQGQTAAKAGGWWEVLSSTGKSPRIAGNVIHAEFQTVTVTSWNETAADSFQHHSEYGGMTGR